MISTTRKPLAFYFSKSLLLHFLVFILFAFAGKIFKDRLEEKKMFNVNLVENSVRVDMVAMPKMTIQELKQLPQLDSSEVEEVQESKPKEVSNETSEVEFEKKVKKKNFLDMMKNLSNRNVEKVKPKKKTKKKNNFANSKKLRDLVIAGNKVSSGKALVGTSGEVSSAFANYMSSLPDRVRVNWVLPGYLANSDLKCRIRVFINKDGELLKAVLYESSGNDEYDKVALEAVKRTSFPKPEESFIQQTLAGQILLGFPL